MKSVLFAAAEFSPFVKAGGLGDVVGALPYALRKKGADARVIMPYYAFLPSGFTSGFRFVKEIYVNLGWRKLYCGLFKTEYNGLPMYFIDNKDYFGGCKLYYEMESDIERFSFFCAAVLNALPHMDFKPDVIHCHDWHTSMLPILYHAHFRMVKFYGGLKFVFTVHNLKYQGMCNKYKLYDILGINDGYSVAPDLALGFDAANCMKGGIFLSDAVTTVSETYAREICDPYYGEGLDWLLRWRGKDLIGIVNGIDAGQYDPSTDKAIARNYDAKTAPQAKKLNKLSLQAELSLTAGADRPVIAMITRLVDQKGLDLVMCVFDEIVGGGAAAQGKRPQFVLLGNGDAKYEEFFRIKERRYPGDVAARIKFDEALARRIYAGADFFLMPSLFEPCGISQLIAMRYGTLPIVRETGGLSDTVLSYNEQTGEGNGYSFKNINAHDMLYTIGRAVSIYRGDPAAHAKIVAAAMAGDYSWDESAAKYIALYERLAPGETA